MLNLTADEAAELTRAAGNLPLGPFVLSAALQWVRSTPGRYQAYIDSGRMDADDAVEAAEALRLERAFDL